LGRPMEKDYLILKRASASRPSGEWNDDDFDVLADGVVVGRIFKANAAPVGSPWMWSLAFGHHEDRSLTHGYAASREDGIRHELAARMNPNTVRFRREYPKKSPTLGAGLRVSKT
jgi:hypothetical protein